MQRLQTLRSLFKPAGTPHTYTLDRPPLFQRPLIWWAKWAFGLIACDMLMTGSAMEITWRHWSVLKPENKEKEEGEHWQLRPLWQRAGLCTGFFAGGVMTAAILLIAKGRYVRTLDVFPLIDTTSTTSTATRSKKPQIPAASGPRKVFLQTTSHRGRGQGVAFPLSQCSLQHGRDDSELVVRIIGERGHWYMNLDKGALVNGQKLSKWEARDVIVRQWKEGGALSSELGNPTNVMDGRWKKGPVAR
ncbi:hypothetical protein Moror_17841 [Moniliophthora roreri MCA 2997]|uniref:Uncharacterized protein n=1 Tax=Moniliophthora roreri (strain MCA 2997) TaxID=1381753 RepID=V2XWN3_MONRO|nr:hypothetical protein Moror_17841 [Moniliophthora roreri MCA 2997]